MDRYREFWRVFPIAGRRPPFGHLLRNWRLARPYYGETSLSDSDVVN